MATFGPPQHDADHWPPLGTEPPPPPESRLGWSFPYLAVAIAVAGGLIWAADEPPRWAPLIALLLIVLAIGPMVATDVNSWLWTRRLRDSHQHWRTDPYQRNELGNLTVECPCGALIVRTDHPGGSHYLTIEQDGATHHRYTTTRQRP